MLDSDADRWLRVRDPLGATVLSEVQLNRVVRRFCKFGIEDKSPNYSVFCRARHGRFRERDAFRRAFEGVLTMCIAARVVAGEAFSVGSRIRPRLLFSRAATTEAAKLLRQVSAD